MKTETRVFEHMETLTFIDRCKQEAQLSQKDRATTAWPVLAKVYM